MTQPTKRFVYGILVCVVTVLLVTAFVVVRDVSAYGRRLGVLNDVKQLGVLVENFRENHGDYPSSLPQLQAGATLAESNTIGVILREHFKGKYDYRASSTGFLITVRGEHYEYQALTNGYNVIHGDVTNQVRVSVQPSAPHEPPTADAVRESPEP